MADSTSASRPAARRRPAAAREPYLDVHNIQGNILAGFNKDHQRLIAVRFQDIASARRWLRRITGLVSTTAEVNQFNDLFRKMRARLGFDPPGLVASWMNIAFSRPGLTALTTPADADAVPDQAFVKGLPARAGDLRDPPPRPGADPTADWVVGAAGQVPDALLIVAGDDPGHLTDLAEKARPNSGDGKGAPEVVWEELGQTLTDLPGHEHFGFKDGVSQPGVRGFVSRKPNVPLTPRLLAPPLRGEVEFARPGQPLVWPGQFVFGYPSTDINTGGPVPVPKGLPALVRNGSLLVFRRLRQDVAGFTAFVHAQAATLAADPAFPGMSPDRLGALLVGRWASGAPIARSPSMDLAAMARDPLSDNDFLFLGNTPPPIFLPGISGPPVPFPTAVTDELGLVCPHAAHIRKMNPRDQDSDRGTQFDTLTRRILRRGIPYGPPLADRSTDDGVDRGLHFISYQTSIERQFELLQMGWANEDRAPLAGGHDVIIGQTDSQTRQFELLVPDGSSSRPLATPRQWVVPTGGGYFFAPSISTIRDILGGAAT